MNVARLQQAIDRIVPIRARTLGIEFQAEPCNGAYFVTHDGAGGNRRELQRLRLYRPCAPTQDAVTDTAIEMLSRLHERFGPGKVWTLGNDGASKRIHVMADDGNVMADDGNVRTNGAGQIMLRMFFVHEHQTIGPNEEDPESKLPWVEVPRQYMEADQVRTRKAASIGRLNEDLAAGRVKVPAPPVWNRECLGEWVPATRTFISAQDAARPAPHVKGLNYALNDLYAQRDRMLKDVYEAQGITIQTPAGPLVVKADPTLPSSGPYAVMFDPRCMVCGARGALHSDGSGYRCVGCRAAQVLTPAGRIEAVLVLAREGKITQEQARALLEMPAVEPRAPDPLDVKHGGVTLRDLLKIDEERRREGHPNYRTAWGRLSDAQRAAVSAHWSAELRARVEAAKERERRRVTVDLQDID